jgi:hypothetical protein
MGHRIISLYIRKHNVALTPTDYKHMLAFMTGLLQHTKNTQQKTSAFPIPPDLYNVLSNIKDTDDHQSKHTGHPPSRRPRKGEKPSLFHKTVATYNNHDTLKVISAICRSLVSDTSQCIFGLGFNIGLDPNKKTRSAQLTYIQIKWDPPNCHHLVPVPPPIKGKNVINVLQELEKRAHSLQPPAKPTSTPPYTKSRKAPHA